MADISCSLPNADQYPGLNAVVKQVQTHNHTAICQKKLGVTCRFNAPWPPSTKTVVTRRTINENSKLVHWSTYHKDILSWVLSILPRESNNADLTETGLFKVQVLSEE